MRFTSVAAAALLVFASAAPAQAQVSQTWGVGSAVTTITNSASFESVNALNDNPYVEDGLSFTRTNLSFNNNGCEYAGCSGHTGFIGFTGNYMYGTGTAGFFSMLAPTATKFYGLEFIVGTGFSQSTTTVTWQAFLGNIMLSSGSTSANVGDVIGFSSATGFDELRYTDSFTNFGAPAFDEVKAMTTSTVP